MLRDHTLLQASLGILDDPPSVINCSNCEVWILPNGTIEQRPHRPESYLRHCLDVKYEPAAECPEYDKALLGIPRPGAFGWPRAAAPSGTSSMSGVTPRPRWSP